jgi:hypothetical protein
VLRHLSPKLGPSPMIEVPISRPIPADLRASFLEAVEGLLPDWRGAPPEPEVTWDRKPYPISAICNFVNNPNFVPEQMPPVLLVLICDLTDATLPPLADHTYQGGARYVAEIIERRRRQFRSRRGGPLL